MQDGIRNFHNNHILADENPHEVQLSHNQYWFSLNVYAVIIEDDIIGPVILPASSRELLEVSDQHFARTNREYSDTIIYMMVLLHICRK